MFSLGDGEDRDEIGTVLAVKRRWTSYEEKELDGSTPLE